MAEAFKHLIDAALVRASAAHLARAWPAFDTRRFTTLATRGLAALEMKARAMHIASALEATLPQDFGTAAGVIEAALAPAAEHERLGELRLGEAGLAGWVVWPLGEYAVRRGMAEPERALALLEALTQRFSAEFALRPFIAAHPALAFETLARWAAHPNVHVRRLASEGSRPRLPWGLRLQALVADPRPVLPLLQRLQDDPSAYVRRSVANHLNDIAKDHPALVAAWLEEHLPGAGPERRALLRHASRTLVKQGDARVLAAWGLGRPLRGQASLAVSPSRVRLGGAVELQVTLRSTAAQAQRLVLDLVVHHVKADGRTSPKVFKGWTLELPARGQCERVKRHALRPISTRRYFSGRHRVELQANGRVVAAADFELDVPAAA